MATDDSTLMSSSEVEKTIQAGFKPFCFVDAADCIRISSHFSPAQLIQVFRQIPLLDREGRPLTNPTERNRLIAFLVRHKGTSVTDLQGYTPHNFDGSPDYDPDLNVHHGHFVFGRLHTPAIDSFKATLSAERRTEDQAHGKLTVPLFNAALYGQLSIRLAATRDINNGPVDLLIPATYKVVRWQTANGNHCYTTELVNCDRTIDAQPADNPFDSAAGYAKLLQRTGRVRRIDPDDYPSGEGPVFSIQAAERFLVGFDFPQLEQLDLPGLNVKCEATAQATINTRYTVAPGRRYAMHNAMDDLSKRFEHIWSSQPSTSR